MSSSPLSVAGIAPRPAALAIICAVPVERRALGEFPGVGAVVVGGIGPVAAAKAADHVLAGRPSALISAGFCGALDPSLDVGDLVAASEVIDAASGERIPVDAGLLAAAPGLRVPLVSAPRLILDPAVRAALPGRAVDMESAAIGRAAARAGVPFLALRAVTDAVRHRMPDLSLAIEEDGRIGGLGLARHVARHPGDLAPLLRLAFASRSAGRALRRGIEGLVASL